MPLTFRGALQSEAGAVTEAVATMRGLLREVDFGGWKPRETPELKGTMAVRYYKLEVGGETIERLQMADYMQLQEAYQGFLG